MEQKQQQTAKMTQDILMKLVRQNIPENLTLFSSINRFHQQQKQYSASQLCFLINEFKI